MPDRQEVLIVGGDAERNLSLAWRFEGEGNAVTLASDAFAAIATACETPASLVVVDAASFGASGVALVDRLLDVVGDTPLVVLGIPSVARWESNARIAVLTQGADPPALRAVVRRLVARG